MKFPIHLFALLISASSVVAADWKKHIIHEGQHTLTAVGADFTGDGVIDVISSTGGKTRLFVGPDWTEHAIHIEPKLRAIHSEVLDVDGDGDWDYATTNAHDKPFWLENPGKEAALNGKMWTKRIIDHDILGIHCMLKADVDNDGTDDLIINNFEPKGVMADSIAWFKIPADPKSADHWIRNVFADKTARGGSHYFGFGDIDGDGWGEISAGAKGGPFEDGNWFAFWKNPGKDGVTGPWKKTVLAENQLAATNIIPANVNGDGKPDFIASRGHSQGVLWIEAPDWKVHEIDPDLKEPHSLTVSDFDQDGDLDAATCGYGSELVMWYENDGKGNFTHHQIGDKQGSYDTRTVDMDGDGDGDLLIAGRQSQNVVWYENPLK